MNKAFVSAVVETEFPTGSASHVAAIPQCAPGELIVVVLVTTRSEAPINPVVPGGWTVLASLARAAAVDLPYLHVTIFGKVAAGSESTENFTTSQTDVVGVAQALRITGWSRNALVANGASGGVIVSASAQNRSSAPNPAAVSVSSQSGVLYLAIAAHGDDGAVADITAPAGYEGLTHTKQSSGALRTGLATAHLRSGTTSENAGAFTLSADEEWIAFGVGIAALNVGAGRRRERVVAEIDGIEYEVDTPEQLRQLRAKAHEAEVERAQLRRLERAAEELASQRRRERAAQEQMDRAIERQAMVRIEAERAFKEQQDKLNAELAERLVLHPQRERFYEPRLTSKLSSNVGLRRMGRADDSNHIAKVKKEQSTLSKEADARIRRSWRKHPF